MANTHKGKFFSFFYLLFILCAIFVNYSSLVSTENDGKDHLSSSYHEPENENRAESNPQEFLLYKLEELVRNLSEVVTRLETKLSESKKVGELLEGIQNQEQERANQRKFEDNKRPVPKVKEERTEVKVPDDETGVRKVQVTKYSPFWSERFQFISAVKLDSRVTAINVLPFRDYESLSRYVAVGDHKGRIYVFTRNGDVLIEYNTQCDQPVTAMLSYLSVYRNESFFITGHQNGVVLMHKVHEVLNGEEWGTLTIDNVGKHDPSVHGEEELPINILDVHHVGRSRYILSSNSGGDLRVFRENGTLHGSAMPSKKPLAFLKQRLLFLTEGGAGSLDLRSMKIRETGCEGLNDSRIQNYVFDATERSKAYGYTAEGDLIHVLLLGDVINFKCRMRSRRQYDMPEPVAVQAIKGYLLVVNEDKVFGYNVSTQHYVRVGGPRLVFSAGLDEILSSFLNYQVPDAFADERKQVVPLIASDRDKLVVLGLGSGYVGVYRSNLPVFKGDFNSMLWTSPVLFFILFLFGAWQFFAKKKEALTSWGPDDPFSSTAATTPGAPLVPSSRDRPFADSPSRREDVMELRTGGLRGPPRGYGSPPRYPGGATSNFRPNSADTNNRPTSVDPNNYRTPPSELKYRGSTLESTGFPKRRENLFGNNQVDDSN